MTVKYDKGTSKWFSKNIGCQTTVCRCDKCNMFYKPSLGHKCRKKVVESERMTKGEYCKLKGLHTCNPAFNPDDELDEEFKNAIDTLVDNFDDIYNDDEDCEV